MVKLEEVEDDIYPTQPNVIDDEDGWDTDKDSDSDISEISDTDAPPEESITDRLYALKDIIPPQSRRQIGSAYNTSYSWGAWSLGGSLKLAWQISTSVLLLVVPFSLVMMEDQAIAAEEQQMKMREMGSDMMTQNTSQAE